MSEPAIEIRELTKRYGDMAAVDSLDLSVDEGRIFCLLGPNGSGKTTTVAMLTTLRRPTAGTALICGHDIATAAADVRSVVGVTLQHTGVDDLMTGREMLSLQAALQGMTRSAARSRVAELVDLLELGSHIDIRLGEWSGGLRRRMDLAAALVHRPRLLFLDEPTTGLDPSSRRALWDEVRRLNRDDGVTVFMTTQYLEEADALAHEVSILRNGRLLVTGPPHALKEGLGERTLILDLVDPREAAEAGELIDGHIDEDRNTAVRVVVDRQGVPACLGRVMNAGLEVTGLSIAEPSLEDVFLRLTTTEELV